MALYRYDAIDTTGSSSRGKLEAESDTQVRHILKSRGLYPTSIHREDTTTSNTHSFGRKPGLRDVSLFARQLGTLLDAGFTMVDSLNTIIGQTSNQRLAAILGDIKDSVRRGESLSLSLTRYENVFPPMYVTMIVAGEQSGQLPAVLTRVAEYIDRRLRLRNKVLVSLAYPCLMALTSVALIIFLVTFIAPTLTEVFIDADQNLPSATVILMETSRLTLRWWPLAVILALCAGLAFRHWISTEAGAHSWDSIVLRLPYIGSLMTLIAMARFARTLGVLLESGVEILTAFGITGNVLGNRILTAAVEDASSHVSRGADLADPLRETGLFPPMLVDMIAAGQKSGRLPHMLLKVADDMDENIETQLSLITSLIEPLMILVMGSAVGFIVLAVILPIFEMNRMF